MKSFFHLITLICTAICVSACSKEDPNPEIRDPIYADLAKRAADYQKTAEESGDKIKELRANLEKAEPFTLTKKDIEKELAKTKLQNLNATQWARYYKIRTDRRLIVDKLVYKEAFQAKKEWPDPREYSDYLTNQRLSDVNLNWAARVPKLQSRLPSSDTPKKPEGEAKKEE